MTESTREQTRVGGPSRAANVGLWVLQVLAAAVFVFSGLQKVTADPLQVAGFEAMGLGITGMYLIGSLELVGAVALLVPRLVGLAALCFVALMIGAVIATYLMMALTPLLAIPAVTGVVVAVIAWGRRRSTVALARLVSGRS